MDRREFLVGIDPQVEQWLHARTSSLDTTQFDLKTQPPEAIDSLEPFHITELGK